jgi:nucleoside-diphosphate-sugar epimerase
VPSRRDGPPSLTPCHGKAAVLLTGATGFIGRRVMRRLLTAGRTVIALARARSGESAAARVARAVGERAGRHLMGVVEADFTRPDCGLGKAGQARLRERVETVIHCAGQTTFFPDEPIAFRNGHLDGPLRLLGHLHGGRLRRWAYLSTAYVCGRRTGIIREDEGDVGQAFHNPYERMKLEAEMALQRAGVALDVDVRVFRPSIVVGLAPATPGGSPSNVFFGFIRTLAAAARRAEGREIPLRIPVPPQGRMNLVPVDYVAEALVLLADHPEGGGKTFHLVSSHPPTHEALLATVCRRFGLRGPRLIGAAKVSPPDPSALERRIDRMLASYHEYLQQEVEFDDRNARHLLCQMGVSPPRLSAEAIHQLIDLTLRGDLRVAGRQHLDGDRIVRPAAGSGLQSGFLAHEVDGDESGGFSHASKR